MARYQKQRTQYPMGTVSSGTMREEDLIPDFCCRLSQLARQSGIRPAKARRAHLALVKKIERRIEDEREFIDGTADDDLESLFDALHEYSALYSYFGAHPGDGADYGWWLLENWDKDFRTLDTITTQHDCGVGFGDSLKVSDLADVPSWYRGEVAVVNDHGNVTLYIKTCRTLRAVWSVV